MQYGDQVHPAIYHIGQQYLLPFNLYNLKVRIASRIRAIIRAKCRQLNINHGFLIPWLVYTHIAALCVCVAEPLLGVSCTSITCRVVRSERQKNSILLYRVEQVALNIWIRRNFRVKRLSFIKQILMRFLVELIRRRSLSFNSLFNGYPSIMVSNLVYREF